MIVSFGNKLAEHLFDDEESKETRKLPVELRRTARRKILYLHDATELADLRTPPGNRLEVLTGNRKGFHSVRIIRQWRITFRWQDAQAFDVSVEDYHD